MGKITVLNMSIFLPLNSLILLTLSVVLHCNLTPATVQNAKFYVNMINDCVNSLAF